ncbi:MAG: RDD family protein [Microthrixaceae bacterium]|nr:RDD family protein [Microthrixaceae bacterium]
MDSEEGFRCWRCQASQPPRRTSCWRCGAIQISPDYPLRVDDDGEFCDDPNCEDCNDEWEDDLELDWVDDSDSASSIHPSQLPQPAWDPNHAAMMHPAARAEPIKVGLTTRTFAAFLSMVVWWVVVLVGFSIAKLLYGSPPEMLLIGLALVPLFGETALTAELGVTPGKFLLGLRTRSGTSKPGWSRSIIRTFVMVGPFLFMFFSGPIGDIAFVVGSIWIVVLLVSIASDPDKRGFHDHLAGTSVVSKFKFHCQ